MSAAPDYIDRLGDVTGHGFHLDGPYDASLPYRQGINGPLSALGESNAEALAVMAVRNIVASLAEHAEPGVVASTGLPVAESSGRLTDSEDSEMDMKVWPFFAPTFPYLT